jgi:hypothetical protein
MRKLCGGEKTAPSIAPRDSPATASREAAHLKNVHVLDVVPLDDGSKREIGDGAEARNADFFSLKAAQIANIGTNEQRLGKVRRHRGYLDDIAAAQHVGDNRRTAKTRDIGRAG